MEERAREKERKTISKSKSFLFRCKCSYFVGFINSFPFSKPTNLGRLIKPAMIYTFVCRIDVNNKYNLMRGDKLK